jgi:hypothetical protein
VGQCIYLDFKTIRIEQMKSSTEASHRGQSHPRAGRSGARMNGIPGRNSTAPERQRPNGEKVRRHLRSAVREFQEDLPIARPVQITMSFQRLSLVRAACKGVATRPRLPMTRYLQTLARVTRMATCRKEDRSHFPSQGEVRSYLLPCQSGF